MNRDHLARADALDLYRLTPEPAGDDWKVAWECVDLARAVRNDATSDPNAGAIALAWTAYRAALRADQRLSEQGRSSADDSGDSASSHVRNCLDSLCGRALRAAADAIS